MSKKEKSFDAQWRLRLKEIQNGFPSPWKDIAKDQFFENTFKQAISEANELKHHHSHEEQSALKCYFGNPHLPDYSKCKDVVMNQTLTPHQEVIRSVISCFSGLPNWGHPQTLCNVNPPPSIASIIAASLGNLFNPDIMEGEYSWNVAKAEIESGAMLAELMNWDASKAGGVYTFGGTGSYMYALKLAMTLVLGQKTREEGIRQEGQLIVAKSGHYAKETCADWLGLGTHNIRRVNVDSNNRIDLNDLKKVMKACKDEGKPIVMVVCTTGTTDAFGVDPILEIRTLIDSYENANGRPKPLLYADAVIGWPWMSFKNYDFKNNPLEFSSKALAAIEQNYKQIAPLTHVDAMGIDFHKTGWSPFNSSFFLVKESETLSKALARALPPYLQLSTSYNPFIYTLETSRGANGALSGWASLKFFGYEGYQVMMGRIVEVMLFLRKMIQQEKSMVCVNPDNYGFVTLFRVYPRHINAEAQYTKELNDPAYSEELETYNTLQKMIADKLFSMLRDPKNGEPGWENPPYTSFTQGYRSTDYPPEAKSEGVIHALKAFPMSPFSNETAMLLVRNYVLKARDLVIQELLSKRNRNEKEGKIQYKYLIPPQEKQLFLKELKSASNEFKDGFQEEDLLILREISLLAHLSMFQLNALIECSTVTTFEDGTLLFL
ncbi:MAG: pyridoxal phosphate-dependent decarboxylase family protein, partial [Parachlamydiaceae bacterium]